MVAVAVVHLVAALMLVIVVAYDLNYDQIIVCLGDYPILPEPDCITGGGPLSCVTTGGGGSLSVLLPFISS